MRGYIGSSGNYKISLSEKRMTRGRHKSGSLMLLKKLLLFTVKHQRYLNKGKLRMIDQL